MDSQTLALAGITLVAATVNGALGYGFSSLTVPVALLFLTNRVLNPALVPIEVVLNGYVLWVNRASIPVVWRRTMPIVVALAPGIVVGTALVSMVNPNWLKFITYTTLLPLILLQAAGFRRPIQSERAAGYAFGGGLGVLYSMTTISGPPLAVALSNQGLAKQEFRAALGIIRLAESSMTAVAYAWAGLYSRESFSLIPVIIPSLAIGVPLGAQLIRHLRPETFRRICMSFDAWVVAFGLSGLMRTLQLGGDGAAYGEFFAVVIFDIWLLYRFFTGRQTIEPSVFAPSAVARAAQAPVTGTSAARSARSRTT
jgi:uncharacterized membrane protein YfcA